MTKYTYERLRQEYEDLWKSMKITRDFDQLKRFADKITANSGPYKQVEKLTGVPWQLVAVIHVREAGLQDVGVWKGVLHNGERIIGTGRKTTLVPSGRGPFSTWVDAAVDALKQKGFDKIKYWSVSRMLWALEPFNGYGYRNKGLRSPYLWASTNHQQRGKYVSDGVFDSSVMDTQMGCAAMLKYLNVGVPVSGTALGAAGSVLAMISAIITNDWQIIIGVAAVISLGIAAVTYYKYKYKKSSQ